MSLGTFPIQILANDQLIHQFLLLVTYFLVVQTLLGVSLEEVQMSQVPPHVTRKAGYLISWVCK